MKPNETLDAQGSILWDKPKLQRFKAVYKANVAGKRTSFLFDGHEIVTAYAKYLIEYLDMLFKTKPDKPHAGSEERP